MDEVLRSNTKKLNSILALVSSSKTIDIPSDFNLDTAIKNQDLKNSNLELSNLLKQYESTLDNLIKINKSSIVQVFSP